MVNKDNRGSGFITRTVFVVGLIGVLGVIKYNQSVERYRVESAHTSLIVSKVEICDDFVIKETSLLEDYKILGQFIYGEGANQREKVREAVGKTITNRVGREGYMDTLEEVIMTDSRYTCVGSKKNKNWKQATGELKRNGYEEMIYQRCLDDAKDVLNGKNFGYENQDKWIAYFDKSTTYEKICKFNLAYWKTLKPDVTIGDITFCIPKTK